MIGELRQRRPPQPASKGRHDGLPPTTISQDEKPGALKVWILASRPHTLTASVAPVVVGAALACTSSLTPIDPGHGVFPISVAFAAFACLIQLGTNLHNDYADFVKGADDERRVGQARATQRGWLSPGQTAGGATLCLLCASAIGLELARIAGVASEGGGFDAAMVFVVATSVFNAVAYTGGPFPLGYIGLEKVSIGYSGLGDVFVFLYFGLVATLGVPYLYLRLAGNNKSIADLITSDETFQRTLLSAIPIGNLATAIIVVNNLRDRKTDVGAAKRTLAVRFGEVFARVEYAILVVSSYMILFLLAHINGFYWMLPLLSLPAAIPQLRAVALGGKDGADLNEHVGGTARVQLLYCLLLTTGIHRSVA